MLEVMSLSKKYGKIVGATDISFNIKKGTVVGFIGPNGAGKSTTMNMITGCIAPTSGTVFAEGISLSENPVAFKRLIGYLPEQPPLYSEFTVYEYLSLVLKMKNTGINAEEHINEIIQNFGLSSVKNRLIRNLSKGYKQRTGLAQAFVGKPDYVILDEPTVGLDPVQKKQTLELIKKMSKDYGILLSSHILSEISSICSEVIIINNGQIVKEISDVSGKSNRYSYRIRGYSDKIMRVLMSTEGVLDVEQNDGCYIVETTGDVLENIFFSLAENKLPVTELKLYSVDVESEFIKATERGMKGGCKV